MAQHKTTDEILQESNDSLKKASALTAASKELAADTLSERCAQGELMENVDTTLYNIDNAQCKANTQLNSMIGFWGYIANLIYKIPVIGPIIARNTRSAPITYIHAQLVGDQVQTNQSQYNDQYNDQLQNNTGQTVQLQNHTGQFAPILELSDVTPQQNELYHANEEMLVEICGSLAQLSQMATQMGHELDAHNQALDTLIGHTDQTDHRMGKLNRKINTCN